MQLTGSVYIEDVQVKFRENESKYLTREDVLVQIFDEDQEVESFPPRATGQRGPGFQRVDQVVMARKRWR